MKISKSFKLFVLFLIIAVNIQISIMYVNNDQSLPIHRCGHNMVYIPEINEIVMFGGTKDNSNDESSYLNDTWIFSCSNNEWRKVQSEIGPDRRSTCSMAYDSINKKVILFGGGNQDGMLDDTWIFDPFTYEWIEMTPNTHPLATNDPEMIYDTYNEEILLFGGAINSISGSLSEQTWIYTFENNTWTQAYITHSPSARYGHEMAYNNQHNLGILFGGNIGLMENDLWCYNSSSRTWIEITTDSPPPERYWHEIAFDSTNQKLLMFGGRKTYSTNLENWNDTWVLDFSSKTWEQCNTTFVPKSRMLSAMVYNSEDGKILMYAGCENPDYPYNDFWEFDINQKSWKELSKKSIQASPVLKFFDFLIILPIFLLVKKYWIKKL